MIANSLSLFNCKLIYDRLHSLDDQHILVKEFRDYMTDLLLKNKVNLSLDISKLQNTFDEFLKTLNKEKSFFRLTELGMSGVIKSFEFLPFSGIPALWNGQNYPLQYFRYSTPRTFLNDLISRLSSSSYSYDIVSRKSPDVVLDKKFISFDNLLENRYSSTIQEFKDSMKGMSHIVTDTINASDAFLNTVDLADKSNGGYCVFKSYYSLNEDYLPLSVDFTSRSINFHFIDIRKNCDFKKLQSFDKIEELATEMLNTSVENISDDKLSNFFNLMLKDLGFSRFLQPQTIIKQDIIDVSETTKDTYIDCLNQHLEFSLDKYEPLTHNKHVSDINNLNVSHISKAGFKYDEKDILSMIDLELIESLKYAFADLLLNCMGKTIVSRIYDNNQFTTLANYLMGRVELDAFGGSIPYTHNFTLKQARFIYYYINELIKFEMDNPDPHAYYFIDLNMSKEIDNLLKDKYNLKDDKLLHSVLKDIYDLSLTNLNPDQPFLDVADPGSYGDWYVLDFRNIIANLWSIPITIFKLFFNIFLANKMYQSAVNSVLEEVAVFRGNLVRLSEIENSLESLKSLYDGLSNEESYIININSDLLSLRKEIDVLTSVVSNEKDKLTELESYFEEEAKVAFTHTKSSAAILSLIFQSHYGLMRERRILP